MGADIFVIALYISTFLFGTSVELHQGDTVPNIETGGGVSDPISNTSIGSPVNAIHFARFVLNRGFHRILVTEVTLPDNISKTAEDNCSLCMVETIPSGLYVDLHELLAQEAFDGPRVLSYSKFDVEKPEYASKAQEIYVFYNLTPVNSKLKARVELPVHLRYHKPSSDGDDFATFTLDWPKVYYRCGADEIGDKEVGTHKLLPCNSLADTLCRYESVHFSLKESVIKFAIPVGQESHIVLIIVGTIGVTVLAVLFLLYVIGRIELDMKKEKVS